MTIILYDLWYCSFQNISPPKKVQKLKPKHPYKVVASPTAKTDVDTDVDEENQIMRDENRYLASGIKKMPIRRSISDSFTLE